MGLLAIVVMIGIMPFLKVSAEDMSVKEYLEVIVQGQKKYVLVTEGSENVVVDDLILKDGMLHFELDGVPGTALFKGKSQDGALLQEAESRNHRYTGLYDRAEKRLDGWTKGVNIFVFILYVVSVAYFIYQEPNKDIIGHIYIAGATFFMFVFAFGFANLIVKDKFNTQTAYIQEKVLDYATLNDGNLPITENIVGGGELGLVYEIDKNKLIKSAYLMANYKIDRYGIEENSGNLFRIYSNGSGAKKIKFKANNQ